MQQAETFRNVMTIDEWGNLPEDVPGELVDGCLVEEEMPNLLHEIIVTFLIQQLANWLRPHGGIVFGSGAKYAIDRYHGRIPDISIFLPHNPHRLPTRGVIRIPPDIVIEIVSPRPRDQKRDRVDKIADYAKFGVRYYWIVDPSLRTFEVLELSVSEKRYAHALSGCDGMLENIPGCEGLVINLDELWGELDKLEGTQEDESSSKEEF